MFGFLKPKKKKGYTFTDEDRALALERRALALDKKAQELEAEKISGLAGTLQEVKNIADMMGWNSSSEESGNELVELAKMYLAQQQNQHQQPQQPADPIRAILSSLPPDTIEKIRSGDITEKQFIDEVQKLGKKLYTFIKL